MASWRDNSAWSTTIMAQMTDSMAYGTANSSWSTISMAQLANVED